MANIEENSNSSAGTERCAGVALVLGSPDSEMSRYAGRERPMYIAFERERRGKSWKQGRQNERYPLFSSFA
jgi:hypothetical protein